ncbi:MAG: 30S ribosomal protein S9 [Candidatus Levybacteria bacterium]|nr:30S ribosomal protein S9 [Candidatus Levybacteria bacterium]
MAEKNVEKINNDKQIKTQKRDFIFAVGRRREAVARVRLYTVIKDGMAWKDTEVKKGDIIVNKKPISEYFKSETARYIYSEPLRVAHAQNKYTFTIQVVGGGPAGQLQAVVHGISKALSVLDKDKYRPSLKKKGFLTRDARTRQRRKVGMGGKSRREKQSPKR